MTPSHGPAGTRQARISLQDAVGTVARANPIVAAWRWRYELAGAAGLAAAWMALDSTAAAWLTTGLAAGRRPSPPAIPEGEDSSRRAPGT